MARAHYTIEQKAAALALLDANGGAVKTAARELGIPVSTLRRWQNGQAIGDHGNRKRPTVIDAAGIQGGGAIKTAEDLRTQKREELGALIGNEMHAILSRMGNVRDDANYRELATAFGIMFDKKRLLDGLPTEIVGYMPVVVKLHDVLTSAGMNPADVFERMIQRIQQQQPVTSDERT